jgi:hypothetical protein
LLNGNVVSASIGVDNEGKSWLYLTVVIENIGKPLSGPLFMKIYASNPVQLEYPNTDANGYQCRTFISPEKIDPRELPGGVSLPYAIHFWLPSGNLAPGQYQMLLKVFYGNGLSIGAEFMINLSHQGK